MNRQEENELNEYLQKQQYEVKANDSLIWLIYAQEVYRSSIIIANKSIEANKKSYEDFYTQWKNNEHGSRILTKEETLLHIDVNQIRISYFLLSRAIELILKAILIEINPNRFYEDATYEMKFGNSGHDIVSMYKETNINLEPKYQAYLNTLSIYPFFATYPVLKRLTPKNNETKDMINIDHNNFFDVTKLYDIAFDKLNEIRIENNKGSKENILKIV